MVSQEKTTGSRGCMVQCSWIYNDICNQSVPITTKVVSSNPTHSDVYSIQLLSDKVCK